MMYDMILSRKEIEALKLLSGCIGGLSKYRSIFDEIYYNRDFKVPTSSCKDYLDDVIYFRIKE